MDASHLCTVRSADRGTDVCFEVTDGERVLHEMIRRNLVAIKVGCRGGGCGVCRVRVLDGEYTTRRMSRRHVTEAEEADGFALACRLVPGSDIEIEVSPSPAARPTADQLSTTRQLPTTRQLTTTRPTTTQPTTTENRSWQ